MFLKLSQISELILAYDSDEYKTDTETVVEECGFEEVKNDPLVQHTSTVWLTAWAGVQVPNNPCSHNTPENI